MDTLNENLFSQLRKNGNLKLILKNIEKLHKEMVENNISTQNAWIESVICNLTWRSIPEVSQFALSHGFSYALLNYEPRPNSIAYQEKILCSINEITEDEKKELEVIMHDLQAFSGKIESQILSTGSILSGVMDMYNKFTPGNENIICKCFYERNPKGSTDIHLDIVYDYDHHPYQGILIKRSAFLELDISTLPLESFVLREIAIYKENKFSKKYFQKVLPGYRKKISGLKENFLYHPDFSDMDVEAVLLEFSEIKRKEVN